MKQANLLFLTILASFVGLSIQAWQTHSALDCSKRAGAVPLGKSKKKTLAQCKKMCQKKKKCLGILRKTKNGKKKGMCQMVRKLKIEDCDENTKYTFHQYRGYAPATTVEPITTTAGSGGSVIDYECKNGIEAYPSSLPNSDYYTRLCTTNTGLKIVSGSKASDASLEMTAFLIGNVMANVDPRVAPEMNSNGFRHAVMAAYPKELTTNIPEHAHLGEWWDERARGLGATIHIPVGSSAEENALCHSDDRYLGEDITIHEFAHSLHLTGLTLVFPTFEPELKALYNTAKEGDVWGSGHYAMTNYIEFFAEGVQTYFGANYRSTIAPTTRDQLKTQDPDFFAFLDEYLGNNDWQKPPC